MSEANGLKDDFLDTSNILDSGLTPLSSVENTDSESEFESSYIDPIEQGLSSLDDLVQNIDRLDQSTSSDTSELPLFAQSEPLILDAAVADDQQSEELDNLTGAEIDNRGSEFSAATPTNLNQSIFNNGESTRITLEFIQREAAFRNEVGLYRVDDATGRIGDLLPGDNGYAAAALDPARRIITLDNGAASIQFSAEIEPDTLFGSYLIQNDTSQKFLQKNSGNRLNKKPGAFFSFNESNPDSFDHLQTRVNDSGSIDLAWSDGTGVGEQDFTDSVFTISYGNAPLDTTTPNYAVRAEGQLKLRGRGDYDGEPLNLDDDILIYAGEGFNLAGKPILPVKRDETGNPLVDGQNKQILVDDAITVAPGYSTGKATQSIKHLLNGLTPPQMVESLTVDVPDYDVVKQEQVDTAIGDTGGEITLAASTSLNNTSQWSSNFPAPGTTDNLTVVRVQDQGLTIPHQVDLSNYVIIVEQGDITFQGSNHELDNVVLIAESGKIDLGQAEVTDSSFLAAKSIKVRSNTKFTGDNLIANSQGKIEFYNSQSELDTEDSVRVIAAGDLSIRGRSTLKGEFLTKQDFLAQGRTSVYGSVVAKGDVTFNGRVEMHAITSEDETPPIELNLNLTNDTGVNNTDNISTDATISGTITNLQGDIGLSASFDELPSADFSDLVQPDGSFTLGTEQLEQINGGDLDDGNYTLHVVANDSATGVVRNSILTFVLDRTAPTLELTTPLVDGDHSSRPRLIGSTESKGIAKVSYSLDGSETEVITVDDTGSFDSNLDDDELDTGTHSVTVTATDTAGNQSNSEVSFQVGDSFFTPNDTKGWGAQNDSSLILGEQDSYVVETSLTVALGLDSNDEGEQVGTRTISFDVDAIWGEIDEGVIEDQLLVYLVDPANASQTLLDNGTEGTAVFSLAGEQSDFTPGLVSFDGRTVTIDASSLTDVEQGLLVFQLLNQDDDTGSVVTINNLASTTDLEGFVNPIFPEDNSTVAVGQTLNLDNLTATTDVETLIDNVRFDASTGEYKAQVSIQNNGESSISRNTVVLFNNLPEGVELLEPSGTDSAGNPYLNFRPAIRTGGLDTGAISNKVEVVFSNPNLIPLGLDTTVLIGSPNAAPVFEPIGNLTVTPGEKLELNLAATDPDGDNVTYRLDADDDLPTGMLSGNGTLKFNPQPDELGSYEFTIIATDGAESVSQTVTLDVVADPITTTRISGVIENVEQEPLAGVVIELGDLETVTLADGSFTIETDQPLTDDTLKVRGEGIKGDQVYPFIAEKLPLVLGQEVYEGFHNYIDRPIYLPALDVASGQEIDKDVDATVTTENIPGASVFVEAGSLSTQEGETFTGTLSITEVPTDLTPAALPENLSPDMVVTIQPGEMVFNTPAPLSLPNTAGWAAGMEMDLWSINPETGDFDNVGTGRVSDDGSIIETIEGGIRNSSWHFWTPPPGSDPPGDDSPPPPCEECKEKEPLKSEVELGSGAVIEDYDLVTYASNGESRGISLTYDSLRADPRPILQFGFENIDAQYTRNFAFNSRLIASLSINKDGFDFQIPGNDDTELPGVGFGRHFWSLPTGAKDVSAALQADLQDFSSGKYDYTLTNGIYLYAGNQIFGSDNDFDGQLFHVNSIDSAFGSGWGIAGWQEIVEDSDSSVLLIDGDGGEYWFEATVTGEQTNYSSPHGDYSTLEKLSDGTFRRTMKDQTVYDFNLNNQLASVTDSQSNQTNYIYNEQQQLITILDPVGLSTNIFYNGAGKASLIIDPALRETSLEYDDDGNLISITNPDQSSSSWSYDSEHHMIGEIDANRNQASASYDQFGRATGAKQKDGSVVLVNPTQTRALYPPEETTSAEFAPQALIRDETPTSTYANANGNVTKSELDFSGQKLTSFDGNGGNGQVLRNADNLVVTQTDARGHSTFYSYDERGNVVKIREEISNSGSEGGLLLDTPVLSAGRGVSDTASGDLNNDGIDDLVTANYLDDSVSVLISRGDGTFKPAVDYFINTSERPELVRLGDFDNDGNLDLISRKLLKGNGDGTFEEWNTTSIGIVDAVVDDFNSDGLLDYASIDRSTFSIKLGNGDGSFALSGSYQDGISNDGLDSITSGDIDNDGIVDLIVGGQANQQASVYLGQGDGTFDFQTGLNLAVYADSIKLGDFNQDGNLDLAVAGQSPKSQVSILLGGGDGSFIQGEGYDLSIGANSLVLADFDENGILDLAIAGGSSNNDYLTVLTGSGDGTFGVLEEYPTVIYRDSLSTGDFNSDGIIDLATVSFSIGVPVIYGNGNGTFALGNNFDTDQVIEDATLGDLDRDGLLDLITVNRTEGLISVSKGQGSSTFGEAEDYSISTGLAHNSVETGDFNQDGFLDVVTGDGFGSFSISLVTEDGTLSEKTTYNLDSQPQLILVEDLNQDGLLDLLTIGNKKNTQNYISSVMLGLGDGTFEPEIEYPVATLTIQSATLEDLDQDGNLDLIALGRSGAYVLEGRGDGSFADAVAVETYTSSSSSEIGEFNAVADLNNDTFLDLVISREGTVSVFLGNGDATFAPKTEYKLSNSTNPKSIKIGDLDGNGELDIVYAGNSHNFGVLSGKGDGTFVPGGSYLTNGSPKGLLLADLDNDEDLDVINFDGSSKIGVRANFLKGKSLDSVATKTYTYDPIFNQVTSETDELGRQTLYDIDPDNGNLLSTTRVVGEVGGDDDVVTSYTYTDAGLVDTMTDPLGRVTNYEYDRFGRLIRETYAVGTTDEASVSYEYDLAGNQTAVIDENGNRTEYKYDQKNRVIEIIEADPDGEGELISPVSTFDYDKSGNLIETVDGKNNATEHQYDELDRKTKTIDSLRQETTYEYDHVGNVIAVIDAEGRKTENIYDSRNRLIKTIDPEGNSTKYQYDLDDNVVAVIDSLGNTTRNFYDNRDRLLRTIDAESNVTNYEYDAADNLIATVDANKNRTEYEYDELNRQIKQIDALLGESTTVYDKVSNVISTKDEEKRITNLVYDNRDRLISTTDAEDGIASFEYDRVGNITSITDEEKRTTNFTYDALNRQIEINAPLTQKTSINYDAVGNVTAVTDANDHSTNFTYDKLNRQTVITNHLEDTVKTKYDKVGNVTAVTDELNRTTRFTYDKRNLQTSIIDPLDHTFTREYDAVGNVSSVTDARNNTTRYEYDKLYRLIKEIDANNESITYNYDLVGNLLDFTDELKRTTKFAYDQLNRQITVTDPLTHVTRSAYDKVGNLVSLTDANYHSTYFTYDKLNRQTVATNHLRDTVKTKYDKVGNVTAITDELDHTTYFQYDQLNRQISIFDPLTHLTQLDYDLVGNLTSVTDANKHTTRYEYDELNRQTDIINPFGDTFKTEYDAVGNVTAVTDELKRRTEFAYDKRNLQTSVTNALKNVTRTEYDQVGNVSSVTDANDHTTGYQYDKLNRQTIITNDAGETIETEYDAVDNVIAITDELKRTTKFAYDKRNRQITVTDPLKHTTTSVYDPVGNLLSVRDANQHITSYGYDELNRIISITDHLHPNQPSTFTYDKVGNLILSTDELNRTSTYTYDKLNRQLSFTNDNQQTTTNTYDPVGNLLTVTDPLKLTTRFDYDKLNRQISVTNPNTETTRYTYDKVGNQLSITDPEKNTTSYTYDKLNRLLTDTNQLGKTFTYQYDKVGNVLKTTDRNGREIDFVYDNLNRNTAEIWLDESGNAIRNINLQYDAANQLLNASDPDSAYSYDYDFDGRLISVDNANTPGVPNVVFNYTYDPVDNLTTVEDSINGVDKGVETFTYDELDRVTKITQSGEGVSDKRVDLSYDAASQMSSVTRYSDLAGTELIAQSTYTFDKAGRLTDLTHQQNGTTLAEFGLVYDKGDRITSFTTPDGVADFSYDDSDQLVDASYENQANENYSYDDNGNRTNPGYVTGVNNQLLSDGTYNYEYDNEGNRVKKTAIATGEVTEYEWDHRNRLIDVETKNSDGNVIANSDYTYDVFDNRISKSVDADGDGVGVPLEERYVLDGDHIALTFDGEGNQTERFLHGLEIDQVLASENADGEVLWALADHLGSSRVLLNNDGAVVNNISYDAFGNITVETNSDTDFRFFYTGREPDPETGFNYNRGRHYDPTTGRLVTIDPIGFAAGDSNLYRYVGNNPLFYLDPSGFCGVPFSDNSDNNDFWDNVSDFFIPPAEAGTLPSLIPPPTNPAEEEQRRILREREREQREDNPLEQGLERTRKFIEDTFERIVDDIDLRDDFRRQIENPDSIEPLIDIFIDIDGDSQTQQPEQTTISQPGAFDPNRINFDTYEPPSDPFNVEKFGEKDYNNDFDPNTDGYELDNDTKIEPTRDFEDDYSDLSPDRFEARKKRKRSDDFDDPAEPLQEYKQPKPNISGKEGAKDIPSWARGERPYVGESGKQFARRILDAKYGSGNYDTKPGSEFNKLKKYGDRNFQ